MARVLEQELICTQCGKTLILPECHGKGMECDGDILFCPTCGKERKIPVCCGQPMKIHNKILDLNKELFGKL